MTGPWVSARSPQSPKLSSEFFQLLPTAWFQSFFHILNFKESDTKSGYLLLPKKMLEQLGAINISLTQLLLVENSGDESLSGSGFGF